MANLRWEKKMPRRQVSRGGRSGDGDRRKRDDDVQEQGSAVSASMSYQAPSAYPPPPSNAYPPPGQAYPPQPVQGYPAPAYVVPPPPAGYPTKNGPDQYPQQGPVETQSRGDGFWKGCCAALCCCCVLDMCF